MLSESLREGSWIDGPQPTPRHHQLGQWVMEARGDVPLDDPAVLDAMAELVRAPEPPAPPANVRRVRSPSPDDFLEHTLRNIPVLIDGLIDDWPMLTEWCRDGRVDLAAVSRSADVEVPVEDDAGTRRMRLSQFQWDGYLKDWLFKLDGLGFLAPTPPLFERFTNWLSPNGRNYHFCYIGRAGTTTKLHCDVLNSFSWSANVVGVKNWRLLPASDSHLLFDVSGRHLATDFYDGTDLCRCRCGGWRHFPNLHLARPVDVTQTARQVIFVPSGWYHTVVNVEDTLSVNSNWLNATNVHWALARLEKSPGPHVKSPTFGGDNLTALAFLDVLAASMRADARALETASSEDEENLLFQIQRAAAIAHVLASPPWNIQGAADVAAEGDTALAGRRGVAPPLEVASRVPSLESQRS